MRNPTYKHLEARLRLGALTLGQWAQLSAAAVSAALFGGYLSPFAPQVTIFVAIVAAGLPVAVSYGAMGLEFSVGRLATAAWRHWRAPHRYLPGPGLETSGYVVIATPDSDHARSEGTTAVESELLWDA